jgi:hypothetical protein
MHSSPNILRIIECRRMNWAGHAAGTRRMPERKRPLGRPRCRWEDNIKMAFGKMGLAGINWIHLAQEDQWRALPHSNEPSSSIKC